jgi:heptaprenylglyceryl phosphate synthase
MVKNTHYMLEVNLKVDAVYVEYGAIRPRPVDRKIIIIVVAEMVTMLVEVLVVVMVM